MFTTHLRPLTFGEILDGAFTLYRRHFAVFFTTALIPLLPMAFAYGFLGVAGAGATTLEAQLAASGGFLLALPFIMLGMLVMWGALVHEAGEAVMGRPVVRSDAYRVAFRRLLPLLGATLLLGLLMGLGLLLFVVPGVLVMLMLFAIWQVVVLEGKGPVEAASRSRRLAQGAWLRIFGVTAVVWLIVMMPSALTGMAGGMAVLFVSLSSGGAESATDAVAWISAVSNILSTVLSALTTPFMITAFTLLYFDRRVRTEGLDLEMAEEQLPALA